MASRGSAKPEYLKRKAGDVGEVVKEKKDWTIPCNKKSIMKLLNGDRHYGGAGICDAMLKKQTNVLTIVYVSPPQFPTESYQVSVLLDDEHGGEQYYNLPKAVSEDPECMAVLESCEPPLRITILRMGVMRDKVTKMSKVYVGKAKIEKPRKKAKKTVASDEAPACATTEENGHEEQQEEEDDSME